MYTKSKNGVGFAILGSKELIDITAPNGNEFKLPSDVVAILDVVSDIEGARGGPMLAFATYFSAALIAGSPNPDTILEQFTTILGVAVKRMVDGTDAGPEPDFQAGPEGEQ